MTWRHTPTSNQRDMWQTDTHIHKSKTLHYLTTLKEFRARASTCIKWKHKIRKIPKYSYLCAVWGSCLSGISCRGTVRSWIWFYKCWDETSCSQTPETRGQRGRKKSVKLEPVIDLNLWTMMWTHTVTLGVIFFLNPLSPNTTWKSMQGVGSVAMFSRPACVARRGK